MLYIGKMWSDCVYENMKYTEFCEYPVYIRLFVMSRHCVHTFYTRLPVMFGLWARSLYMLHCIVWTLCTHSLYVIHCNVWILFKSWGLLKVHYVNKAKYTKRWTFVQVYHCNCEVNNKKEWTLRWFSLNKYKFNLNFAQMCAHLCLLYLFWTFCPEEINFSIFSCV